MELEPLLQPLANGNGCCGIDMIFSSEFDAIREARRFDDPSLAQGEWVRPIKEAEWEKVIQLCEDVLRNKSKDLRVAAWLTEARAKTDGLHGMSKGYQLLTRLCERFWEHVHPLSDDGEPDQRLGPLEWLVSQTAQLIRQTPLTESAKGRFSLIDQESARTAARNIERNPELAAEYAFSDTVSLESFEAAIRDTPADHFSAGLSSAGELHAAMSSLQAMLEQHLGQHAPSFSAAFEALDDVTRLFRRHARSDAKSEASNTSMSVLSAQVPTPSTPPPPAGGALHSREQALRSLHEIADFFRRTEPHSPVAYLADKAARWGSMPLHEWLRAVVKDDGALARVEELLGVEHLQAEAGER